jgi:hypothetical protein
MELVKESVRLYNIVHFGENFISKHLPSYLDSCRILFRLRPLLDALDFGGLYGNGFPVVRSVLGSRLQRMLSKLERRKAALGVGENQLGRRNLTDDQRAAIADSILERRTALAKTERAKKAGKAGGRHHPKSFSLEATAVSKLKQERPRAAVAKAARVSERKLRAMREIKRKLGPKAVQEIRTGKKPSAKPGSSFQVFPPAGATVWRPARSRKWNPSSSS